MKAVKKDQRNLNDMRHMETKQKPLPNPRSQMTSSMFHSRNFVVLDSYLSLNFI